jgi:riboflavin synthase
MFTGLIEVLGRVRSLDPMPGGLRLTVATSLAADVSAGDSVAVNGVCLTAVAGQSGELTFELGPETARVTALGRLAAGRTVNLERAMRADARVGGHFVQGHVDTTGTLLAIRPEAEFTWMTFSYPASDAAHLILKGAIAVDGISLTIATLGDDRFDVQIIPFTWEHTNLAGLAVGDGVNLEYDVLGKYAVRAALLAARQTSPSLP